MFTSAYLAVVLRGTSSFAYKKTHPVTGRSMESGSSTFCGGFRQLISEQVADADAGRALNGREVPHGDGGAVEPLPDKAAGYADGGSQCGLSPGAFYRSCNRCFLGHSVRLAQLVTKRNTLASGGTV